MRLWTLAALQAAVTLSWMVYGYFQPRLLEHFGFTALAGILAWYLAFAGSTLAPLAGDASDRLVRSGGDRFPVVRAGVALAAASFVAVAVTSLAEGGSAVRFVLPLFVAVWIAGMTLFQAPALAIVRDEAAPGDLPVAMAPLVIATTLPSALWPLVEPLLAKAGGSLTFLAGGVAVTATALALGRTAHLPARAQHDEAGTGGGLALAFACGLVSALVAIVSTDLVPGALSAAGAAGTASLAAIVALAGTLGASAMGRVGSGIGSGRGLVAGLVASLVCRGVAPWCGSFVPGLAVAIVAGAALALHLTTALPFTLSAQPEGRAGLGTGLYVGGAMVGSQLARVLFR
ncbi:MAG TPA: hypothetical protein VMS22_11810 [Candidatus Eisenbacteria bacterium]|nr:hypothetical protein [Candidatus Eisenbacteria bacterium]